MATVNIVCYKWKTLSTGEHPLMICTCKDGKRKYQSIGVSVNPATISCESAGYCRIISFVIKFYVKRLCKYLGH